MLKTGERGLEIIVYMLEIFGHVWKTSLDDVKIDAIYHVDELMTNSSFLFMT